MSYSEYVAHYFQMPQFIIFLLLTAVLISAVHIVFYFYTKSKSKDAEFFEQEFFSLSERYYELIFSGGSIIGFMAVYFLITLFLKSGPFKEIWDSYKDYLLLIFMIISILLNSFCDHVLVRLKHLDRDAMASIRLTGMGYMILILCYLKFIYESNNYDTLIAYFLTLMIGRFVYFDASFKDFLHCIKNAAANIPIMIMALINLSILCAYGYSTGYLLKHNGVITNIFFTHLYMIVVIFVLHFIPARLVAKKKVKKLDGTKKSSRPPRERRERRQNRPKPVEDNSEIDVEIIDL
ncbi:hypothetical protein NXH64_05605 [Butyrivibrio fibrisolvens]|uniref:hypothetical protein n=1 Tax=Pseudobutyrivibrio ruminis TaxID=46206 RepID=UPI0003F8E4B4|nr:hypothetical protein [Pseudobutyrivibrio ruminis]MDC7278979.1 hypothetical protein [Butyrivibrio fibrisolvens]